MTHIVDLIGDLAKTVEDWIQEELDAYNKELKRLIEERIKRLPFCTLDPSVKRRLWQLAADKEREKEEPLL